MQPTARAIALTKRLRQRSSHLVAPIGRAAANCSFKSFAANRSGNIALTFALLLVPLIGAVGASLDYVRAYNIRSKMQTDLDAALLASIKSVGTSNEEAIQTRVAQWFDAQTNLNRPDYNIHDISIDANNFNITATAESTVPTTLMSILGIKTVDVAVSSTVHGPGRAYMNIYVVLDKSASMLLAATSKGQSDLLASPAKCAFACHIQEGRNIPYNGKEYSTVYDLSLAMGIPLRADVSIAAVREVLDIVDESDPKHERIKVGLYTLGNDIREVLDPTLKTSKARSLLDSDSSGLTSATSEDGTYFDISLPSLNQIVGAGGDGKTQTTPKKLVLLLTDGVQSERNWVRQDKWGKRYPTKMGELQSLVTPFNSKWCKEIKEQNVSFGVLYTEYLPMPWDWGYKATLAKNMNSSNYVGVWRGEIAAGAGSTSRLSYIPTALGECASARDLFLHAESEEEIRGGLSHLFKQYLSKVRLSS